MRHTMTVVVAIATCLTSPGAVRAQGGAQHADTVAALERGRQVRLTLVRRWYSLSSIRPVEGPLRGIDADSIYLVAGERILAVPRARVRRVAVLTRTSTRGRLVAAGVLSGTVSGAAVAVAMNGVFPTCESDDDFLCATAEDKRRYLLVSTLFGAGLGLALGATQSPYTWRPVRLPAEARVGLLPGRGVVTVTLRF